jgi:transcriptional regulator with XRE-family HTH domain
MAVMKRVPSLAGRFFKAYRKLQGLTQEELGEVLGIEPRTLRAYENGERHLYNIKELRRIADTLGVQPEYLGVASSLLVLEMSERQAVSA